MIVSVNLSGLVPHEKIRGLSIRLKALETQQQRKEERKNSLR